MKEWSSTNARVALTIFTIAGTAIKYWMSNTIPDGNWLLFLGALAGLDLTAILGKRKTADPEVILAEAKAAAIRVESVAASTPPLSPQQATVLVGKPDDA